MSNSNAQILKMSSSQKKSSKKKKTEKDIKDVNLVKILREQLSTKDVQLREKDKQIDKLLQRQSEQNIIIQTLNNKIEGLSNKVESSVPLLIEAVKENKPVAPVPQEKSNDNGFTIASAIMIILLVVMIVIYLTVK